MATLQHYTLDQLNEIMADGKPRRLLVNTPYHGFAPVDAFMHHGVRPCVEVATADGQVVRCSYDHKLQLSQHLVISVEDTEREVKAEAFKQEVTKLLSTRNIPAEAISIRRSDFRSDHELLTIFIEAQYLLEGDRLAVQTPTSNTLKSTFSNLSLIPHHETVIDRLEPIGDAEVFDLSMNHAFQQGHHSFLLYNQDGSSLVSSNCVSCLGGSAVVMARFRKPMGGDGTVLLGVATNPLPSQPKFELPATADELPTDTWDLISIAELASLLNKFREQLTVEVLGPDGPARVEAVTFTGEQETWDLVQLPITPTHLVAVTQDGDAKNVKWVESGSITADDKLVTLEGVRSLRDLEGVALPTWQLERPLVNQNVYDLSLATEKQAFYANGILVHNCGLCDSTPEVKSITVDPNREEGLKHIEKVTKAYREEEPFAKLLIEVRIENGPASAMIPRWLKDALYRAVFIASEGELNKACLFDRFGHSRQGYRLKADNFKSLLAGSFLCEMTFSKAVPITPDLLAKIQAEAPKHVTPGWKILSIQQRSVDFLLRNQLEYALTTYRFDSRINPDYDLSYLKQQIEIFFSGESTLAYKSQQAVGRDIVRVEVKDYDKANVLGMAAMIGSHRNETILRSFAKVADSHPTIFLAGFLGMKKGGKGSAKSYHGLYGVKTSLDGFYRRPRGLGASIFDMLDTDGKHSSTCPKCSGPKFLNVVSGLPFGNASYEQDLYLRSKYGGDICQSCFLEESISSA